MSPREVELAATGTFYIRDPRPESDDVLPMLPTLDPSDPASLTDVLRWWLAHDDERLAAAAAARAAVADRTFAAAAAAALGRLDSMAKAA